MKKNRKLATPTFVMFRRGDTYFNSLPETPLDRTAKRYLDVLEEAEDLKRQLLRACRQFGFRPPDAPKTKMLAGEIYEVLASRATRTVVDQHRARALREKLLAKGYTGWAAELLDTRIVYDVAPCAARCVENMPAWVKQRFAEVVRARAAGTRLTVRKRKAATEAQRHRGKKAA